MKNLIILVGTLLAAIYFVHGKSLTTREIPSKSEESSEEESSEEEDKIGNWSDTSTLNANKTESSDLDPTKNRFGFNVNKAQANAYGPGGSHGASHATSYGIHAGIVGPANSYYRPLYQKTGSHSNTYSSGLGAPSTWANTNSHVAPGQAGGHSSSGFKGGYGGNAVADSYSVVHRVPLGDGTFLLSNFKNSTIEVEEYLKNSKDAKENLPKATVPEQSNIADDTAVAFPDDR